MILRPLTVGDLVRVERACMGNARGSVALVVEQYDRTGWPGGGTGIGLLFYSGDYDGFSPADLDAWDVKRIGHVPELAGYVFSSVARLQQHWRAGFFAAAWKVAR